MDFEGNLDTDSSFFTKSRIVILIIIGIITILILFGIFYKPNPAPIFINPTNGDIGKVCMNDPTPCNNDTDCNVCIDNIQMTCQDLTRYNSVQTNIFGPSQKLCAPQKPSQPCNAANGGVWVLTGWNNPGRLEWDCLCTYPDYFGDTSQGCGLNAGICDGGTMNYTAINNDIPPNARNCTCNSDADLYIRNQGQTPLCIPKSVGFPNYYSDSAIVQPCATAIPNSHLGPNGTCVCDNNYGSNYDQNKCFQCGIDIINSYYDPSSTYCVCKDNWYTIDSTKTQCLPNVDSISIPSGKYTIQYTDGRCLDVNATLSTTCPGAIFTYDATNSQVTITTLQGDTMYWSLLVPFGTNFELVTYPQDVCSSNPLFCKFVLTNDGRIWNPTRDLCIEGYSGIVPISTPRLQSHVNTWSFKQFST